MSSATSDRSGVLVTDTIAAISTAAGKGGIGIVRISGPSALAIGESITATRLQPGRVRHAAMRSSDGSLLDRGVVLYFKSPASYTGEDVIELQGHGGTAVLHGVLQQTLKLGARLANPGEFTERAFLNDKLDLAQAEAVCDLIESVSAESARAAVRSLEGDFSTAVHDLTEQLTELRVYVEAALDFSEEEIDFLSSEELVKRTRLLETTMQSLLTRARQGRTLNEGIVVVISGPPNVGKSSLLNQLTGRDSAIVTEIAGTTRDLVREQVFLDGLPVQLIDTAGLRKTKDPVELEGIRRAMEAMSSADILLEVVALDENGELQNELPERPASLPDDIAVLRIFNKIDLSSGQAGAVNKADDSQEIYLSAKTGEGIDELINTLKRMAGLEQSIEGVFLARARHVDALNRASGQISSGLNLLRGGNLPELAAEEFRLAQQSMTEITGEFTSDDLLGRIFAGFCIGK